MRTQANFLAIGEPIPISFPDSKNQEIQLQNLLQKKYSSAIDIEWKDILYYAQKNNIQGTWVEDAKKFVKNNKNLSIINYPSNEGFFIRTIKSARGNPTLKIFFPLGSQQRILAGKLLRKVFI